MISEFPLCENEGWREIDKSCRVTYSSNAKSIVVIMFLYGQPGESFSEQTLFRRGEDLCKYPSCLFNILSRDIKMSHNPKRMMTDRIEKHT